MREVRIIFNKKLLLDCKNLLEIMPEEDSCIFSFLKRIQNEFSSILENSDMQFLTAFVQYEDEIIDFLISSKADEYFIGYEKLQEVLFDQIVLQAA